MSDSYDSNDFNDLFQTESDPAPMSEARVRAIASDQHFRDLAAMQQAATAVTQRRQEALQRAEEEHPGFTRFYNSKTVNKSAPKTV